MENEAKGNGKSYYYYLIITNNLILDLGYNKE